MRKALIILVVLAGCAIPQTTDEALEREINMLSACSGFKDALRVANTFQPRMTEAQKESVDAAISIAQPTCHAYAEGEIATEAAIEAVRDALRAIVIANQEVQQ